MGSFICDKLSRSASFPWVFCCHPLWYLRCEINGALKQYIRPFSLLSYLQGLSKNSNKCSVSQEYGYQEIFYTFKHSLSLKILVNKETCCSHCNQSFPLIQNQKRTSKAIRKHQHSKKSKENKHKSAKIRKQHKRQSNLFMYR